MYIVDEKAVRAVATPELAFEAITKAFIAVAENSAEIFPVVHAKGVQAGDTYSIKSGNLSVKSTSEKNTLNLCGAKFGTYWSKNHEKFGIPNHNTTTVLLNPETGSAHAVLNAGYLNCLRTAAANAVATKALARADAKTLSILGAGHQAYYEVQALCEIFKFEKIQIWNRSPERAEKLAKKITEKLDVQAVTLDLDSAIRTADILVTITNARSPLFENTDLVKPGTHISAMGADQKGKQELPVALVEKSRCFADLPEQSRRIGEFESISKSQPAEDNPKEITAIGNVLLAPELGRRSDEEITIFDSSGIAVQDLCAAYAVLEASIKKGLVQEVSF